jgi:hypothetical protein
MPDHVHLLSQGLTPTSDLLRFLTALKKRTGFAYKHETRQQLWQKKLYDHVLRSSDPSDLVAWYRPRRSLHQRQRLPVVRLIDRRRTNLSAATTNVVSALAQPGRAHLKMAAT